MQDADIIRQSLQWHAAGRGVAVAVVVKTWGSAPRPVGARLMVKDDGEFIGSVSGGCIESAVITAAAEVIASQQTQQLSFGVDNEAAWEVGLSCGGEITVWVHPLCPATAQTFRDMLAAAERRTPCALVVRLSDGRCELIEMNSSPSTDDGEKRRAAPDTASMLIGGEIKNFARELLRARRQPQVRECGGEMYFAAPMPPPPRLLIVGATHITRALLPLAQTVGWPCTVIDPRPAWATEKRFPDVRLLRQWPDIALAELKLDGDDALVTLTHDAKIDDPALTAALTRAEPPFYIGALGGRRTHQSRLARLKNLAAGKTIHAPVGLDIRAQTAAEIALSIMAQVVQIYRRDRGEEKTSGAQ